MNTQSAQCAQAIKKVLKVSFPTIKFSVTSKNYSGGDSVSINWIDGPTSKEVDQLVAKYQYGHFDGMTDSYEYSNSREEIPQARFIQVSRSYSEATKERIKNDLMGKFGIKNWDSVSVEKAMGVWEDQAIWMEFVKNTY